MARDVGVLRTQLTRKFTTLADEVNECFEGIHVGAADFAVELQAPEGLSTGGGKRVLQHICLRPRRPGFGMVVAGSVNPVEKWAELRDWEHLNLLYEIRFKAEVPVAREEWEQFLSRAEVILSLAEIKASRSPAPPELIVQKQELLVQQQELATRRRTTRALLVAAAVVLLFLLVGVSVRVVQSARADHASSPSGELP